MKKYFIHNGKDQQGPFSFEELLSKKIDRSTMIWFEGLEEWTKAELIPELRECLSVNPPPFGKSKTMGQAFEKAKEVFDKDYVNEVEEKIPNKTYKRLFKYGLIVFSLVGFVFIISNIFSSFGNSEKRNPEEYLKIQNAQIGLIKTSFFESGYGEYGITGEIVNSAKETIYKDVLLQVEFFTQTNTFLGKQDLVVYKMFPPNGVGESQNEKTHFAVKFEKDPPKNYSARNTKVTIKDADCDASGELKN